MTLPSNATKANLDQSTDDPKLARAELADLVDKFNALLTHLGLSTILSTPLTVGTGLENNSGALQARQSSTTQTGISELATDAEAVAKTDTARVLTPSNLAALGASATLAGLIELATNAEALTGTDTVRGITPASLKHVIDNQPAPAPTVIVDRAYAQYTATSSLSSNIPADSSVPQSSEGTQILSVTITPKTTTNRLRARFQCWGALNATSSTSLACAALFRNSETSAAATAATLFSGSNSTNTGDPIFLEYEWVPGSTSAQTISIRVGAASSGIYINGNNSFGAVYGAGTSKATLIVEEITA